MKKLLLILINLLSSLVIIFSSLGVPENANAIDLILAGDDSGGSFGADDQADVYVNGSLVFQDTDIYAGNLGPIPFSLDSSGSVRVVATDYFGGCRGISALYVVRPDCGASVKLADADEEGCNGFPAHTVFYDRTFDINLDELSCDSNFTLSSDIPANTEGLKSGDKITYTLKASAGTASAKTIRIHDDIPSGTVVVAGTISAGGKKKGEAIVWEEKGVKTLSVSFQVQVNDASKLPKNLTEIKNGASAAINVNGKNSVKHASISLPLLKQKIVHFDAQPMSVPADSSANSASTCKVTIKDQADKLLANEELDISIPSWRDEFIDTYAILCDDQGRRAYPPKPSGSIFAMTRFSDSNGGLQFTFWPGTEARQGGSIFIEADIPHADEPNEQDGEFIGVTGNIGGTTIADTLGTLLSAEASQNGPSSGSGKANLFSGVTSSGTNNEVQRGLLIWLNQLRISGSPALATVDFAPIHSTSGKHASILFYPKNNPRPIRKYLVDGEAFPTNYGTAVLQIEKTPVLGSYTAEIKADYITLPEWETKRPPGLVPGTEDQNEDPRGRAVFGSINPPSGESSLYLGYPYPPPASNPMYYAQFSRCLLGGSLDWQSVTQYSPINVLLTDSQGRKLGIDKDGIFFAEIPSGVVTDGEPRSYVVPQGDYNVEVTGTGSGKATLIFLTPNGSEDPKLNIFEFKAKAKDSGNISFASTGAPSVFKFGGKNIKAKSELSLIVRGIPGSVSGKKTPRIKISNSLKEPLFAATVKASLGKSVTNVISDSAGDAILTLDASGKKSGTFRIEISAPGYKKVTKRVKIKSSKK
jgi:uncharacterized repeat protein (TIGR01451 family)